MRKRLAGVVLSAVLLAAAQQPVSASWDPDDATIAKLEARVLIPDKPAHDPVTLAQYARYYAGVKIDGKPAIRATYVLPVSADYQPGIHIVPESGLPSLRAGGCTVVNVIYDVAHDSFAWLACNAEQ